MSSLRFALCLLIWPALGCATAGNEGPRPPGHGGSPPPAANGTGTAACQTAEHPDDGTLFVRHPRKLYAVPLPFSSDWKFDCTSETRFDAQSPALFLWVTLHADHLITEQPLEFLRVEQVHQREVAEGAGIVLDTTEIVDAGGVPLLHLLEHPRATPQLTAQVYWAPRRIADGKLEWIHLTYSGPPNPLLEARIVQLLVLYGRTDPRSP